MIKNLVDIKTVEEFCRMLNDDRPIAKDGTTMSDVYAHEIKNNRIDKENYIKLSLLAIPEALTLFPNYPFCLRFVWWLKNAKIFTKEIAESFLNLIRNKWTENAYPERLTERALVISEIISEIKHVSFEEIMEISQKTSQENPWWVNDLLYQYNPKKALENLQQMPEKDFAQKVTVRISIYLQDFSKTEIKRYFEKINISEEEKNKLFKWLDVFENASR